MFVFNKLLSPFLTPLGIAIVLIVIGLGLLLLQRPRLAATVLIITLVELYAFATPAMAAFLSGLLEHQYPPQALAATPNADVIVVLGGTTEPALPPRQAPELNERADRLLHTADLYKAGKAKWIIATGGNWLSPSQIGSEADDMRDILIRMGVPAEAIIVEGNSVDTGENASLTAPIMRQRGFTTALLVTSAVHMPRAMAAFRRVGVAVTASTTDVIDAPSGDWPVLGFLPSAQGLVHSDGAIHELIGMLYYRMRGWA
jgi:uncharacterized SAM-binding protein YcdF (DUF218 family)